VVGTSSEKSILKSKISDPNREKLNAIYNKRISISNITSETKQPIIVVKRKHSEGDITFVSCAHCEGMYRRDKLSVHMKSCEMKNTDPDYSKRRAIKDNSTLFAPACNVISKEFQEEI
jgi:hypothetical protein